MMLREPLIEYLKALAEGRPVDTPWEVWWPEHAQELREHLKIAWFLKLEYRGPAAAWAILDKLGIPYEEPPVEHHPYVVPRSWLLERMKVEEIEQAYRERAEFMKRELGIVLEEPIPWDWQELKQRMQEGDEVWYFRSPNRTWACKMGRSGYSIVRNGEPVDAVDVLKN